MGNYGSAKYQAQQLMRAIDQIGQSRGQVKQAYYTQCRAQSITASHEGLADVTGVHSYAAKQSYMAVWRDCYTYTITQLRAEGIGKIAIVDTTAVQLASYIAYKAETVSRATLDNITAACIKLGVAIEQSQGLSQGERTSDFRQAISAVTAAIVSHPEPAIRASKEAYSDARALVGAIQDDNHRLAADLIVEVGARAAEACHVRESQLSVDNLGRYTISYIGKGGQHMRREISAGLA